MKKVNISDHPFRYKLTDVKDSTASVFRVGAYRMELCCRLHLARYVRKLHFGPDDGGSRTLERTRQLYSYPCERRI
jgi:hypothetical protein